MCRECDSVEIHRLIRNGAPFELVKSELANSHCVNQRSPCGKSPLMTASYYCRKSIIELLIKAGAVVNAMDEKTGDTAAHYIAHSLSGHIRQCGCLMVLFELGANPEIRNHNGYTVFDVASKNGNSHIADTIDC